MSGHSYQYLIDIMEVELGMISHLRSLLQHHPQALKIPMFMSADARVVTIVLLVCSPTPPTQCYNFFTNGSHVEYISHDS